MCSSFLFVDTYFSALGIYYFRITTQVTMYSYGTVFHLARSSLHTLVCSSIAAPEILGVGKEKVRNPSIELLHEIPIDNSKRLQYH